MTRIKGELTKYIINDLKVSKLFLPKTSLATCFSGTSQGWLNPTLFTAVTRSWYSEFSKSPVTT